MNTDGVENNSFLSISDNDLETYDYKFDGPEQLQQEKSTIKRRKKIIPVFDMERLNEVMGNSSLSEKNIRSILNKFDLANDSGYRELKEIDNNFIASIESLKGKYPNCSQFLEMVSGYAELSKIRSKGNEFTMPPILLTGPPGVGKTAVVNEVAKLLDVRCHQIDYATVTSGFVISGSSSSWSEGKTGCVVDILRDGKAANPILILDEIDKVKGDIKFDPLGSLYTLLEKERAQKFIDEALNVPVDASHVMFIATANEVDNIPSPIRSRFIEITIDKVSAKHHKSVTQSIYSSLLLSERVEHIFKKTISDATYDCLRDFSPRDIKLILSCAMSKAARRMSGQKLIQINSQDIDFPVYDKDTNPVGFVW